MRCNVRLALQNDLIWHLSILSFGTTTSPSPTNQYKYILCHRSGCFGSFSRLQNSPQNRQCVWKSNLGVPDRHGGLIHWWGFWKSFNMGTRCAIIFNICFRPRYVIIIFAGTVYNGLNSLCNLENRPFRNKVNLNTCILKNNRLCFTESGLN